MDKNKPARLAFRCKNASKHHDILSKADILLPKICGFFLRPQTMTTRVTEIRSSLSCSIMSKAVIRAQTVFFRQMDEGIETDYALLRKLEQSFISALSQRIVCAFETLEYSFSGYKVSHLSHSSKTVTCAEQDSVDIELIIAILIHDIVDDLTLEKHSQMAAAMVRPYFRSEDTWSLKMHSVFQMYYFADKIGQNPCERERWREHQWFASCERFRRDWDKASFDPAFVSKTLSHFTPMINDIFSRVALVPHIISRDASGQQLDLS